MSFTPTQFRPLALGVWGGRAASHFRGALAVSEPDIKMPFNYPQRLEPTWRGQVGTVIYRSPGIARNYVIAGVTRDSTGSVLGVCRVELYTTADDLPKRAVTSDASGNFTFDSPGSGPFYIVAYKVGSPDVAGTSVNTLIAS